MSPAVRKKRVLLVDSSHTKRDLRAEIMRRLGIEVDCAVDIREARTWWRADLYNLVLISAENEGPRDKFCEDIRGATPPQKLAFLAGKPEYLADSANPIVSDRASEHGAQLRLDQVKAALASHITEGSFPSWGIVEACRRISVVRSAADARTRSSRQRPATPRNTESARPQKVADSQILLESSREEMQ